MLIIAKEFFNDQNLNFSIKVDESIRTILEYGCGALFNIS